MASAGLAQSRFYEDQAFINYLQYLQYWKNPAYSKYIM
jgi:mediator of RNA polymerase II transcription subunit 31